MPAQGMVAAGGSAATDGGAGAVQAINDGGGLRGARLTVLSAVTSTFLDAPRILGPQKGAGHAEIELLEQRLGQLAESYPRNPVGVPRTGAAGGLSGGLWAHFGAELVSGADAVLDAASSTGIWKLRTPSWWVRGGLIRRPGRARSFPRSWNGCADRVFPLRDPDVSRRGFPAGR
ncbi:hypothetical protein QFZ33_000391 [Arthrobacter globiformis]|nr:hypothetical protein [Arthrobacter globiformis]